MSDVELVVNGRPVQQMGSGISHTAKGRTFTVSFDALPEKIESLSLVLREFRSYRPIGKGFPLAEMAAPYRLDDRELRVTNLTRSERGTEVRIETDEDVLLNGVSLGTKTGEVPLQKTVDQTDRKEPDGRLVSERTLLFDTQEEPDSLYVKGIIAKKVYNETVDIPIR